MQGPSPTLVDALRLSKAAGVDAEYPFLWGDIDAAWLFGLSADAGMAFDASPFGHDGTLTSMDPATDWVPWPHGTALAFDASDDYINCGTAPGTYDTGDFTLCLWLLVTAHAAGYVAAGKGVNGTDDWSLIANYGTLRFQGDNGNISASDSGWFLARENAWLHISVVRSGSTVTLYGQATGTGLVSLGSDGSASAGIGTCAHNLTIGAGEDGSSNFWPGKIASVTSWKRAQPASVLELLYRDPSALVRPHRRTYAAVTAAAGLSIPIAMYHYKQMMRA